MTSILLSIFIIHSLYCMSSYYTHLYNNNNEKKFYYFLLFSIFIFLFYKSLNRGRKSSQFVQPICFKSRTYGDHIIQPDLRRTKLIRSELKILALCLKDIPILLLLIQVYWLFFFLSFFFFVFKYKYTQRYTSNHPCNDFHFSIPCFFGLVSP